MSFGRITKLNVDVEKCQTHITYENHSRRLLRNNPSGFVFSSMGSSNFTGCNESTQVVSFMSRHFGKGGSLRKTPSMRQLLFDRGICDSIDSDEPDDSGKDDVNPEIQPAEEQQPDFHTCELEELPIVLPQYATIIEHRKAQMQVYCTGWHLQNCHWCNCNDNMSLMPDCYCLEIKRTMDHLDELINNQLPAPELEDKNVGKRRIKCKTVTKPLESDYMIANLVNINGYLKELHDLIEKQNDQQAEIKFQVVSNKCCECFEL